MPDITYIITDMSESEAVILDRFNTTGRLVGALTLKEETYLKSRLALYKNQLDKYSTFWYSHLNRGTRANLLRQITRLIETLRGDHYLYVSFDYEYATTQESIEMEIRIDNNLKTLAHLEINLTQLQEPILSERLVSSGLRLIAIAWTGSCLELISYELLLVCFVSGCLAVFIGWNI